MTNQLINIFDIDREEIMKVVMEKLFRLQERLGLESEDDE